MRRLPLLAGTLLFALLLSAQSWAQSSTESIDLTEPYPLRGQATTITVSDAGGPVADAVVVVTYRPNSQTGSTEVLAATDAAGRVPWTPGDAGIVSLSAHQRDADGDLIASRSISVRFGSFPGTGLLVMIAAGLMLFGGAAFGFAMLFREGQVPEEPPST